MKQCPKCTQVYSDSSLNFCLNDGTSLVNTSGPAPTVIMSVESASRGEPYSPSLPVRRKGINPFHLYAVIGLALTVGGGILFWLIADRASPTNGTSRSATASQDKDEPKKNLEDSSNWIFLTQAADGRIKVYYLRQGRTFKLKFTNNDATAQIRYKFRAEYRVKEEWKYEDWHEATITVKKGQEQLDSFPLATEVEEIRNVEVDIIDWNYK